jgi:glutathione synthase
MIDKETDFLKLVEYNTVASSFGCLCQKVKEMQTYLVDKYGPRLELSYQEHAKLDDNLGQDYIKKIADVFKRANEQYLQSMKARYPAKYEKVTSKDLWTLFVIDKEERNICDQKWIEHELYRLHGMKSMRLTLREIGERSRVDEETKSLHIDGNEIGFVYYRTGY